MKEAMKQVQSKLHSMQMCHPNAVLTLALEAEEIIKSALAKQEGQSNFCAQCEALGRELKAIKQEQGEPVAGMVLVPYEPCVDMKEQGSCASGYDLSQIRAKRVYQSMIDMHQVYPLES